jgi:hypothetical protein
VTVRAEEFSIAPRTLASALAIDVGDRLSGDTVGRDASHTLGVVVLVALHIPLGLLMHRVPAVATLHAIVTMAVATFVAFSGRLDRLVYGAAYIGGSEVLWRMCRAAVFWESGKYAVLLLFIIALVRLRPLRLPGLPLLYFLLLLPSIALAPYELLSSEARQQISFNLSGPAVLAVSVCVLSQVHLGPRGWRNTLLAFAGPLVGLVAITVYSTLTASTITFALDSNKVTSGGFGPNQVSTVLGLGALLAFLAGIEPGRKIVSRCALLGFALLVATQSGMTFSRGGLYAAAGAVIASSWYLLRDSRARVPLVLTAAVFTATAAFVVLPRLERFTQGKLVARFQQVAPSGRDKLALEDLDAFVAHPIGGLGPGGGFVSAARWDSAHTEFTRLLAEHGVLGVAAVLLLFVMASRALRAAGTVQEKALVIALVAWSFLTMSHSAMRLAAPSLVFGLAFAIPGSRQAHSPTPGEADR